MDKEMWKERLKAKHSLTDEDLCALQSIGKTKKFCAGTCIVRAGEVDDNIFIIKSGIWREYCFNDGEEATIWFSVAGEITFSVWGYVHQKPSRLFFESITDSEAICVSRKQLSRLFETSLRFANLGRSIVEEFILLYERWHIQMWRQNAFDRYLNLLEEYPEEIGAIPLKYIASYLGITVQSLSRIRASLKNA